jgi:hypothetical protein
MIRRVFRCDPSRLRRLLEGRLSEGEEAELNRHLESCEPCLRGLESLAADSRWWDELRGLLGSRPDGDTSEPDPAAADTATYGSDEADTGAGPAIDFLSRSDDPRSLGRLGPYEITGILGTGGMGVVLKALDHALDRVVAIKVLAPELATRAAARRRFAREARAAAAVVHDHVVAIHAVDEANGLPYLVMQYVPGGSLQERIDRDGPLELKEILRIGMQAAAGLAAAHAQGLVHRDVKPSNILLENGTERVNLTDFGLARAVDDASMTQSGLIVGTPQYMAPEQASGEAVDYRADLFSLGSVLYTMCAGHPPFRATTTLAVLRRVCDEAPRPLRQINPEIPRWLEAVVARLHAKAPADRFPAAAAVADELGRRLKALQETPGSDPEMPRSAPSAWRSVRRIAAGLFLALAVGLGATEALGVTHLADAVAMVLRIRTPAGTLVVRIYNPEVKVRIDDQGDFIAGIGQHQVRLSPGLHRVMTTQSGGGKMSRWVSISRGDEVVMEADFEPKSETPEDPALVVVPPTTGGLPLTGPAPRISASTEPRPTDAHTLSEPLGIIGANPPRSGQASVSAAPAGDEVRSALPINVGAPPGMHPVTVSGAPGASMPELRNLRGRVVAPDGRPARDGVRIYVSYTGYRWTGTLSDAATGVFHVPCEEATIVAGRIRTSQSEIVAVAAAADGFGFGWADPDAIAARRELIVQLGADQAVRGWVRDPEGKPVPGARVNVEEVWAYPAGDLARVLQALREGRLAGMKRSVWKGDVPGQLGGTTTGTEGQFHLARLGRDRVVHLRIDGPSIRPSTVTVLTVAPGTHLPDHDEEGRAVYGATFVHQAAPAAPGRP